MTDGGPRVEVYLRSLAPTTARDEQERVLARLERLEARGDVAGYSVELCGECVCRSSVAARSTVGRRLLERYEQFAAWAAERDRELVGFDRLDTTSLLTGTEVTGVVFPRLTVAEFRDGELDFVAPSTNGTATTTVLERLERY